jgi:glycerophosphoryl diester phosphodiesterase
MKFWKAAVLVVSSAGLYSVVNYSAEVGNQRQSKRIFDDKYFWVIAHRGFSGKYPENTLLAFEKAAALPIDAIELDVHSTRDGRIVVIHDENLERTTNKIGRVFDYTWEEIKKLDAGYNFDPENHGDFPFRGQLIGIPLLEDVFRHFPQMKFIVEIKQAMPAIEDVVYRLVRKYKMEEKVILASEHHEPLLRFRNINPVIATSFSRKEAQEFYQMYKLRLSNFYHSRADAVQIPERYRSDLVVTRSFVNAVHRKRMVLHVWTVNDPPSMRRLIQAGVDGIITDFPDLLLEMLPEKRQKPVKTLSSS